MFPLRFFPAAFFAPRFFPEVGAAGTTTFYFLELVSVVDRTTVTLKTA